MPLNESSRKSRDRWPLAFDLEGVPRENAERERLLQEHRNLEQVMEEPPMEGTAPISNSFAVDYSQGGAVIDINNPPRKNYNPHDPKNEFPKMLYNHDTGKVLCVNSEKEETLAVKKHGFSLKPAPDRDYHTAKSGMVAPMKQEVAPREEALIAKELAEEED